MAKSEVILYSYFRSSASYRVRIALALKQIPYEYRPVHLLNNGGEQRSQKYRELNPMGHVPTLIVDGFAVAESMAIIDYLDAYATRDPRLFPEDKKMKAKVIQVCELINSGIQPLQNIKVLQHLGSLGFSKEKQTEWMLHWIHQGFESLEIILKPLAGTHCFGSAWTAADCFLVPQCFAAARFGVDIKKYPTISRLYDELGKTEAVAVSHPANQPDSEQSN